MSVDRSLGTRLSWAEAVKKEKRGRKWLLKMSLHTTPGNTRRENIHKHTRLMTVVDLVKSKHLLLLKA